MIKTQVQIPDELFQRAKEVAARKEWSFAELVRRGLEYTRTIDLCAPRLFWFVPGASEKPRPLADMIGGGSEHFFAFRQPAFGQECFDQFTMAAHPETGKGLKPFPVRHLGVRLKPTRQRGDFVGTKCPIYSSDQSNAPAGRGERSRA